MFRCNERGSAVQGLIFSALVLVVVLVLIGVRTLRSQFAGRQLRDDVAQMQLNSAAETAVLVFRLAEISYIESVQNCATAKPFLRAMKEGSDCDQPMSVDLFTGEDAGTKDGLYTFGPKGCNITQSGSNCTAVYRNLLFTIGTTKETKLNDNSFRVSLLSIDVAKQIVELMAEVTTSDGKTFKNQLAIRSTSSNFAHLEADGRVTQEAPDPLAKCTGTQWGTYSVFDPVTHHCAPFGQLGSGTGLAYYNSHYFGFRPADGQVVDLVALGGNSSTYMVDETGNLAGTNVFPAYSKESLTNVDDITVSNAQVQFVAGQGSDAYLGLLRPSGDGSTYTREVLCHMGTLGWAQSYAGVAAMSWNEALYPYATLAEGITRIGMFMLKTDAGDLLTAVVRATKAGYDCVVFKEQALQQVEYRRTYGFDRTDDAPSFYVY